MKGKKPCDREGYRGHWVVNFSSGFAPRIFNKDGTQAIVEPDAVKLGYYVQVNGDVGGNGSAQQPGVFVTHSMVAKSAYGTEIVVGPDATQAGFGTAALPPGASTLPPAGAFNPVPLVPGAPTAPNLAPALPSAPAPTAPAFAPSAKVMTAAANGATYEAMIANGWTDATLVQHGMMLAPVAAVAVPPPLVPVGSVPAPSAPVPIVPAPIPVMPSPQFVQVPGVPSLPVPAPGRMMTAAANGATYEAMIANGWTDATLVQHGMMTL
jgi:hypothetical protein